MMRKATDEQIIEAMRRLGSVQQVALELGVDQRNLHGRIAKIEHRTGEKLRLHAGQRFAAKVRISRDTRPNPIDMPDGVIMVASDAHFWSEEPSTAHRGFAKLGKMLKPDIVVMNGDEFDGASISRHGRIGWEHRPTVGQELAALKSCMEDIRQATRGAKHLGSYGNHTMRWDTYLSGNAPAMEGVPNATFDDLLPSWHYAWAWMVNGHTLIKHRIKGGIHATWNNTAEAQVNTVTGHLHNLRVTPRSTMSPLNGGHLYGVDTGMLADPWGPQFAYVEQGPRNWRSGFAVLTFSGGNLMPPELVQVIGEDQVFFRGRVIDV